MPFVDPRTGADTKETFEPHAEDEHPAELNLLSRNQSCGNAADLARIELPLAPGQASVHSALCIHGSEPNLSTQRRCGVAVHYVPTSVRSADGGQWEQYLYSGGESATQWRAVLVAGSDSVGTFGATVTPAELKREIAEGGARSLTARNLNTA